MQVLCSKTNEIMTFSQNELLVRAFRLGVKDVISLDEDDSKKDLIDKLKEEKYYTTSFIDNYNLKRVLFFRNKKDKEYFLNNLYDYFLKPRGLHEVQQELGSLLGFPPAAVKRFAKRFKEKHHDSNYSKNNNIPVNYNGMYFSSYKETFKEDLNWLLARYSLENDDFIIIDSTFYRKDEMHIIIEKYC